MIEITARKKYGDRVVLDVDKLRFEKGRVYALIGTNGSGKSTLLQTLAKVIDFKGDVKGLTENDVAYMPQKSFAFSTSVLANVTAPCPIHRIFTERAKAKRLLKSLALDHLSKKNASRLSGGETQRVALARMLVAPHDFLLLDEPSASMDVESTLISEEVIKDYLEMTGCTLIFATHSITQAKRLADEVIVLDSGKVVERGFTDQVLENPENDKTKSFLEQFNR